MLSGHITKTIISSAGQGDFEALIKVKVMIFTGEDGREYSAVVTKTDGSFLIRPTDDLPWEQVRSAASAVGSFSEGDYVEIVNGDPRLRPYAGCCAVVRRVHSDEKIEISVSWSFRKIVRRIDLRKYESPKIGSVVRILTMKFGLFMLFGLVADVSDEGIEVRFDPAHTHVYSQFDLQKQPDSAVGDKDWFFNPQPALYQINTNVVLLEDTSSYRGPATGFEDISSYSRHPAKHGTTGVVAGVMETVNSGKFSVRLPEPIYYIRSKSGSCWNVPQHKLRKADR